MLDAIHLHVGDNIAAIVSAAPTGATFFFESGVYRGVSLTPKTGQTFLGVEGAVLNGSEVLSGWTQSGNLWVIGGQTQQGVVWPYGNPGAQAVASGSMRAGFPETVFVDDKPLKPVDALSKVVSGTFYFDYIADKIYIGSNPAGHKIEAGKLADAFHGSASNVTVQNLVIEKYDSPAQMAAVQGTQSWIIQDNEVRLNYGVGIWAKDNSKIVGNFVHDNGQMGLAGNGKNLLVEGNEISKNGFWSGIDVSWEGGGTKFAWTDGLIVRNNYSHDNRGLGLWTDIDNIHTLYEDNLVVNNTGGGIQHELSYDATIRNNTLMGNGSEWLQRWPGWLIGAQIHISNSSNVDVYGNRIEMTGTNGIALFDMNRGSGKYGPWVTTGNKIHDNIIVSHDGVGLNGGDGVHGVAGLASNTWSNNHYYLTDGNRFLWGSGKENFDAFRADTHETGSLSQAYPNTDGWMIEQPRHKDASRP